jgi:ABC-2 type transport system permease protein
MARLLVRLKLRLLTNALHASGRARVSFVLSTIWACIVAIATFVALSLLRGDQSGVTVAAAVFTVFAFGWLILPLLAFGLDGTLDPATLALYPLRPARLAVGLLAASATGAWPLANVIGLLGVTVGLARGGFGIIVAIVAVLLQLLFCITLARFVTTGLAGLLRSRRGKDFAAFLIVPIFAIYEAFGQVVPRLAAEGKITSQTFARIDLWLRWLPPGLATHAIANASDGQPGPALLRLALLAAIITVLAAAWIRTLGHALVTVDSSTASGSVRGGWLPFPRSGIRGTVAGRYLAYQRRDPTALVRWCILGVVMLASSVSTIRTPHYHVALFLSAILGAGLLGVFNANTIGSTGPAFTLEATSLTGERALRAYFAGRALAIALIAVPLLIALSVGLATFAGHPAAGFWVAAIDLAGVGGALALSGIYSVLLAFPTVKRVGTPLPGTAEGYAGQTFAASFGSLLGVGLLVVPVIVAVELSSSASAALRLPLLLAGAAAYSLAIIVMGTRLAARAASRRLPELTQTAARSQL